MDEKAGWGGDVILWELSSGQQLRRLEGHNNRINNIITQACFSPDGTLVAAASWNHTVRIWDVSSGGELKTLGGHGGAVFCVAFSPDGKTLVSGTHDRMVRVWDVSSGKELQRLRGHHEAVSSVAFSPDGQLLASGALELPSAILIWKAEPSIAWLMDDFKRKGKVDAGLLGESVRQCREKGRLVELADALKDNGFFEEAAKIYDEISPKGKDRADTRQNQSKKVETESREKEDSETESLKCSCGDPLQPHWKLCPSCGKSIDLVCSCGEPLKPGWKLCPACGKRIDA